MMNQTEFLVAFNSAAGAYQAETGGGSLAPWGYTHEETWQDAATGFKARAYSDGAGNYILAFAGTEDFQDAYQDLANYGWAQWVKNRQEISQFFQVIKNDPAKDLNSIQFTGHSLGGALAQYSAYDFALEGIVSSENLSITTFNALGGELALKNEYPLYNSNLLANANIHHYFDPSDLVSMLSPHLGGQSTNYQLRTSTDPIFTFDAHTMSHIQSYLAEGTLRTDLQANHDYFEIDKLAEALQIWGENMGGWTENDHQVNDAEAAARIISMVSIIPYVSESNQWGELKEFLIDNIVRTSLAPHFGITSEAGINSLKFSMDVAIQSLGKTIAKPTAQVFLQGGAQLTVFLSEAYEFLNGGPKIDPAEKALSYSLLNYMAGATLSVDEQGHFDERVNENVALKIFQMSHLDDRSAFQTLLKDIGRLIGQNINENHEDAITLVNRIFEDGIVLADFMVAADSYTQERLLNLVNEESAITSIPVDPLDARLVRYSIINRLPFILENVRTEFIDPSILNAERYALTEESEQYWGHRLEFFQQTLRLNNAGHINIFDKSEFKYFRDYEAGQLLVGKNTFGQGGSNTLQVSDVSNIRFGTESNDAGINGYDQDDYLYGRGGHDTLHGHAGRDYLEGNAGNDTLHGGTEIDYLYGGDGDDHLHGDEGNDYLIGGDGSDTYYYVNDESHFGGHDKIDDVDAGDRLNINGSVITTVTRISPDEMLYQDEQENTYLLGEYGGLTIRVTNGLSQTGTLSLKHFDKDTHNFGITFNEAAELELPETSYTVGTDALAASYGERIHADQGAINNLAINLDATTASGVGNYDGTTPFKFEGGNLADSLTGGGFSDQLNGLAGDDYINGLGGNDFLDGGLGGDTLLGGEGNDFIAGNNINKAPYGDSTLYREESAFSQDYIVGGEGDDTLSGDEGNDTVFGGSGKDSIAGGQGADILSGGSEDDTIFGDSDRALSSTSFDSFTSKVVYIDASDGVHRYDDIIDGGDGNDHLLGEIGNDTIQGGSGDDWIMGDRHGKAEDLLVDDAIDPDFVILDSSLHGNDSLFGGAGVDTIAGNGGDDYIDGGADKDYIWGDDQDIEGSAHGKDTLLGGTGDDQIIGGGQDDILHGGDGRDILIGDEELYEGDTALALAGQYHGRDEIYGGNDNDTIIGGGNHDTLHGDKGNDIIFGDSYFDNPDVYGSAINYSDTAAYSLSIGQHGNDTIYAGDGDDWVYAGAGDDTIYGGSGIDVLKGQEGNDRIEGGSGDDFLVGGTGNDVLVGGRGNDYLRGGDGADTYVFRSGDEGATIVDGDQITINFEGVASTDDVNIYQSDSNVIMAYSQDSADYVIFRQYMLQNIDAIHLAGGEQLEEFVQEISVENDSRYLPSIYGTRFNDTFLVAQNAGTFSFANDGDAGTTDTLRLKGVSAEDITVRYNFSYGNRNALGFSTNEYVNIFGDGFNAILGDFYSAGTALGVDQIVFDDGTTWSASDINLQLTSGTDEDEYLPGTQADNVFIGRKGNDILGLGRGGKDIVQYNLGDGWDSVSNAYGLGNVIIEFGEGIRPEDLILNKTKARNEKGEFNVYIEGVSGGLSFSNFFSNASDYQFSFSFTGELWNYHDILDRISASRYDDLLMSPHPYSAYVIDGLDGDDELSGSLLNDELSGGKGNDLLKGFSGADSLFGGDGDDVLLGHDGNDVLDGGAGNDYLDGEAGQDTYVLQIGNGHDYIRTASDRNGLDDVLIKGVAPESVTLERVFNNLIISLNENDAFTIENYFDPNVLFGAIKFEADSEEVWLPGNVDTILGLQTGTDISSNAASITGSMGNDRIFSTAGAVIDSQGGFDFIESGSGADTLLFGIGSDQNSVQLTDGNDTIQFKGTLTPNDLNIYFQKNLAGSAFYDLIIEIQGTDDKLRIIDFTAGDASGYRFYFPATSETLTLADLPKVYRHSDHVDSLFGSRYAHNSAVYLGSGNDVFTMRQTGCSGIVYGGKGNDHYTFDRNYESWVIDDHEGENIIQLNMPLASSSSVIERQGTDLLFRNLADTEHVTIKDFFISDTSNDVTPNTLSEIRFLDYAMTGNFWTVDDVLVHLGIHATNAVPDAADDEAVNTVSDTSITIDVLSNDSDENSHDTLSVVKAWASNGVVEINADGTLNYTPDTNFMGADVIGYALSDDKGEIDLAHVTVNVNVTGINEINEEPVVTGEAVSLAEDSTITIDVLSNDTDPDGDVLSVTNANALNGTVVINPDGTLDYTPNANFHGMDTIGYDVSDGNGGTASASVSVTVTPENDEPAVAGEAVSLAEDSTINIDVLSNDSDPDGDVLSVTTASASNGTVVINPDSTLDYTPNTDFYGTDTISYEVTDGNGGTASASVRVTVTPENDEPIALADSASTNQDTTVIIDVLLNDRDIDGDSLGVTSATAANGSVTINPDDTLNYTPNAGFYGTDTLIYQVADGLGGVASATATIQVNQTLTEPSVTLIGTRGHDTLTGGAGDDTLIGLGGYDVMDGGAGNDSFLIEGFGNKLDTLQGGSGFDQILGGAGDDEMGFTRFDAEDSIELIDGGAGINVIRGNYQNQVYDFSGTSLLNIAAIYGEGGYDTLIGSTGNDTFYGGTGNDLMDGGEGDDVLYGESGHDRLIGSQGNDTLVGGSGNDYMDGQEGDDTFLIEGALNHRDTIIGGSGFDRILGSAEDDVLSLTSIDASNSIELIDGLAGINIILGNYQAQYYDFSATTLLNIDAIYGDGGYDTLIGSAGHDTFYGGTGNDLMDGGEGDDVLYGESGHDRLTGSQGNDTLIGGTGNDVMDGGDGDDIFIIEGMGSYRDTIQGGSGFDQILGGAGDDQMGFTRFDATNSIELIDGGAGVNTIVGSYQSETFDFSASTLVNIDAIYGEGGNDILIGSQGNDTLDGGTWHDILEGGNGDDILIGGGGSDVFRAGIGIDTLRSHKASLSEKDTLEIMGGHAINDLWFTQTGNDLDIFILGTHSQIKIENWYTSDYEKVDVIKNNGYQMHKHSVEALVNAMAGFGAPSGGTISLSASEQMQMSDAIAAAWQ